MVENKLARILKLDKLFDSISNYLEARLRLFKLEMGEVIAESSARIIKLIVVGLLLGVALMFLSIAGCIFLGNWLGNYGYGFLIGGGTYLVIGIILFLLWDKLGLKQKIYSYLERSMKEDDE